jgi:hypothetical protein
LAPSLNTSISTTPPPHTTYGPDSASPGSTWALHRPDPPHRTWSEVGPENAVSGAADLKPQLSGLWDSSPPWAYTHTHNTVPRMRLFAGRVSRPQRRRCGRPRPADRGRDWTTADRNPPPPPAGYSDTSPPPVEQTCTDPLGHMPAPPRPRYPHSGPGPYRDKAPLLGSTRLEDTSTRDRPHSGPSLLGIDVPEKLGVPASRAPPLETVPTRTVPTRDRRTHAAACSEYPPSSRTPPPETRLEDTSLETVPTRDRPHSGPTYQEYQERTVEIIAG